MTIIQWYRVTTDYVEIKFNTLLNTSRITNDKFVVTDTTPATPLIITDPFKDISVTRDYSSISRILYLWWNFDLSVSSTYEISISGLLELDGSTPALELITFATDATLPVNEGISEPPERDPVDVEDYSIKSISDFILPLTVTADADHLTIIKVVPESDIAHYLQATENEGKIEIWFNQAPAANFISTEYFKVQRKLVTKAMSRWESIAAKVTADSSKAIVYIYLPSLDATPVYGYQVDKDDLAEYFETGYKYRVIVSQDVAL